MKCLAVNSQLQTSFRTCVIAQIVCGPLLLFLMVLVCWYVCFQRQDLAWNTFLFFLSFYVSIDVVFEVRVLGNSATSLVLAYAMLFAAACMFILTELMNARARRKAREGVSDDEKKYEERWGALQKDEHEKPELLILNSLDKEHLPGQLNSNPKNNLMVFNEALKQTRSAEVLQDCKDIDVLYNRAESINDAFQSLVSILLETGLPALLHHGSLSSSLLKKALAAHFDEVDIDKILQHLESFDRIENSGQSTKKSDGSTKLAEHDSPDVHLPGQIYSNDAVVNIRSDSAAHGAKLWVRRGPVKLPARAIAKVS